MHITWFGASFRHSNLVEDLTGATDDDTDALVVEETHVTPRSAIAAFLKNPAVTLFVLIHHVLRTGMAVVRRRQAETTHQIAAEKAAAMRQADVIRVDDSMLDVIRAQGWSWAPLSWLFLSAIVSPFLGGPGGMFSAVLGAFLTMFIVSYAFIRTSTAARNRQLLDAVQREAERTGHEDVCVVVDRNRVDDLASLASMAGIDTAHVTPSTGGLLGRIPFIGRGRSSGGVDAASYETAEA